MRRLSKFLAMPTAQRSLLIRAAFGVMAVRVLLGILPFRTLQGVLAKYRVVPPHFSAATRSSIDQIVWAVKTASRYVPNATCLTQALVAQVLLAQHGYASSLRIGVAKTSDGEFHAHAWLESHARIVVGEFEAVKFSPFPTFEAS